MRPALILCLLLSLPAATPARAGSLTVVECRGEHGERVFADRGACAAEPIRTLSLTLPDIATPAPTPIADSAARHRDRRSTRASAGRAEPDSYLCTSGDRSWYQHSRCSGSRGDKGARNVKQTRVPRSQACREISRAAALLRKGSERDDRAGPYAKATGRDPCR